MPACRDKSKIPRPPNAFMTFRSAVTKPGVACAGVLPPPPVVSASLLAEIHAAAGGLQQNYSKVAGAIWGTLSEEEQKPFYDFYHNVARPYWAIHYPSYNFNDSPKNASRRSHNKAKKKLAAKAKRRSLTPRDMSVLRDESPLLDLPIPMITCRLRPRRGSVSASPTPSLCHSPSPSTSSELLTDHEGDYHDVGIAGPSSFSLQLPTDCEATFGGEKTYESRQKTPEFDSLPAPSSLTSESDMLFGMGIDTNASLANTWGSLPEIVFHPAHTDLVVDDNLLDYFRQGTAVSQGPDTGMLDFIGSTYMGSEILSCNPPQWFSPQGVSAGANVYNQGNTVLHNNYDPEFVELLQAWTTFGDASAGGMGFM